MALYHSARGSVGYTIVGSPTIIDGVMSGIDDSNYAEVSADATDTDIHDYEFGTEVVIPAEPDRTRGHILAYRAGSLEGIAYRSDTNTIRWYIARRDGTATDINIDSSLTLSPGDTVLIHCSYLGNNVFQLAVSKDNGINWTKDTVTQGDYNFYAITTDQRLRFGRGMGTTSNYYFSGSINLKKTYIKVGGQAWFGICPVEVQSHQLRGPVGYEVTGSPSIVDGVASGFSADDTVQSEVVFPNAQAVNGYAWQVKFTTPATALGSNGARLLGMYFGNVSDAVGFGQTMHPFWRLNGSAAAITTETEMQLSTTYFMSGYIANGVAHLLLGTSEDNQTEIGSLELPELTIGTARRLFIGTTTIPNVPYTGTIDLNYTWVKIGGKLWYWQPRETEKIVVNGVEVWTKPNPTPVIDANTVALFHGDTDTSNAIQGSDTALESMFSVYSTDKKFGEGSLLFTFPSREGKDMLSGTAPIPSSGSFTWDMWVNASLYAGSSDYQGAIGGIYSFPSNCSAFVFRGVTSDSSKVQVYGVYNNSTYSSVINLDATAWHHIAFEYDSTAEVFRWYVNGSLILTVSVASAAGLRNLRSNTNGNYERKNLYIDELRISDVARYGGNNFTPNTLPYGG